MPKCSICNNDAIFRVKDLAIFYCKEHSEEFFTKDSLQPIDKLKLGTIQAEILKKFLDK